MTIKIIAALAAVGFLAACAETPTATEADFGMSARSLIAAQTANPLTLSNPSVAPVTGVDPDYANDVVGEMRKGFSKSTEIKKPIEMYLLGGQQAGD
jgi:type IV pilus biogenesis protein CpaD/CtpE